MFSKFNNGIRNITPDETISFEKLVQLIRDNPNKEKILQIRKLRATGDDSYSKIKKELPCITVNAVLKKRKLGTLKDFRENFISTSGYVYLDFDCTVGDAIELKNLLVSEYGDKVAMVCFSSSMAGVSVLVRYSGVVVQNEYQFKQIRKHIISNYFADLPFSIDENTSALGQIWFISHDESSFVNHNSLITVPLSFQKSNTEEPNSEEENVKINAIGGGGELITLDFTLLPKIKDFLPDVKWCTDVKVKNKILDVKQIDYRKLHIPQFIKDGNKRKTYLRIFTTFMALNPHLTIGHAISFLKYINENRTADNGMSFNDFRSFILGLVRDQKLGRIKSISRKKHVHFNKNAPLNKYEKIKMASQINAKSKANENIMKILQAKMGLGENVRKVDVKRITGLSRPTIDRYWSSGLTDLNDIDNLVTEISKKYT